MKKKSHFDYIINSKRDEMISQTDALGNVTVMEYDNLGRVVSRSYTAPNSSSETYKYLYNESYTQNSRGKGMLDRVVRDGHTVRSLDYDENGRVVTESREIDGIGYSQRYEYDQCGRLSRLTWPDGFNVVYNYNNDGDLSSIKNGSSGAIIYSVASRHATGHPTVCWFGNNTGVEYTMDVLGTPTQIKYGYKQLVEPILPPVPEGNRDGLVNIYEVGDQYAILQYLHDADGYITRRSEQRQGQYEQFAYDALGRLTQIVVNGTDQYDFAYDGNGNMTRNTKLSSQDYSYDPSHPHAVQYVQAMPGTVSDVRCEISYNNRNRPKTISEGGYTLKLFYGEGLQRERTVFSDNNGVVYQTYHISPLCERELLGNNSRWMDYVYADGRIVAIHVNRNGVDSMYYET